MTTQPIPLEDFLSGQSNPGPVAAVEAPELGPGGAVHIRDLSLAAALRLGEMDAIAGTKGEAEADAMKRAAMAEVFAAAVCKADGTPLFPDEPLSEENRAKVGRVPMPLVARVATAVNKRMAAAGDDAKKG